MIVVAYFFQWWSEIKTDFKLHRQYIVLFSFLSWVLSPPIPILSLQISATPPPPHPQFHIKSMILKAVLVKEPLQVAFSDKLSENTAVDTSQMGQTSTVETRSSMYQGV